MTSCLSFAGYLRLLDWSGRLFRPGKARVPKEVAEILQRLGSSPDLWHHRLKKLRETARIYGVVFGGACPELCVMQEVLKFAC